MSILVQVMLPDQLLVVTLRHILPQFILELLHAYRPVLVLVETVEGQVDVVRANSHLHGRSCHQELRVVDEARIIDVDSLEDMLSHYLGLLVRDLHVLGQSDCHLFEAEHAVPVQVQSLEGLNQLVLIVAVTDEVDDEDQDSVLDVGLLHLFELLHVHEGVQHKVGLHLFLLSLP